MHAYMIHIPLSIVYLLLYHMEVSEVSKTYEGCLLCASVDPQLGLLQGTYLHSKPHVV